MRHQGTITDWNDDKGFGFITPIDGGQRVFVHISSFSTRHRRPTGNDLVSYELTTDTKGRLQAANVAFVGERRPKTAAARYSNVPLVVAFAFLLFVAAAVLTDRLPIPILMLYLLASTLAFGTYAVDKSAAQNDEWRVQESTLHLFAVLGGWPGALAAQRLYRHKTRKQSFQIEFWCTVIINCGDLGWLFTPSGAKKLHSLLLGLS